MSLDLGSAVGYLLLDTSNFRKGFTTAYEDMQTFFDSTTKTNDKLTALSSAMTKTGGTMTKNLTLPIVGMGTAMVTTATKFESAMSEVAAISGATGDDLQALSDKAKEMGATTKFSASDSAEALKYMAMAGWDTQKMLDGLPGIMNLAAASGEDLGLVSDIVTDAMTAFGLSADQAGHFADVLAQASNRSNTNVSMLGESFKYVAPVAGALGFSIEDTAVALGLMANSGIKASQAGTSLRSLFTNLTHPVGQAADAIEALNISITNTDGTVKPLSQMMGELREKFSSLTEAEKAQYAAMLAGQEGMSGLLAIVNASDTDFNNLTDAINNADGAAQTMSDTMQDNLSGQLVILKSTIEGIAISFGDIMLPAVKSVVKILQDFATWLNNLSEGQKKVIAVVASFVAAIGPLLLIFGKVIAAVASLITIFSSLSTTIGVIMPVIAGLTIPIAAVVAAVVALSAAWKTNFMGIQQTTQSIFASIQSIISSATTIIQAVINLALNTIKGIWDSNFANIQGITKAVFNTIQTTIQTAFSIIQSIFSIFAAAFTGDWKSVWENVKSLFSTVCSGIQTLLANLLNLLIQILIGAIGGIIDATMSIVRALHDTFESGWNAFIDWLNSVIQDPVAIVNSIGDALGDAGAAIFNSLWNGAKGIWDQISNWVNEAVEWLRDRVTFWENESAKMSMDDSGFSSGGGSFSGGSSAGRRNIQGSFASGLNYVPRDMDVRVHEGEAILTKEENKNRKDSYSNGNTFVFNSPEPIDEVTAAREFRRMSKRLAEGLI